MFVHSFLVCCRKRNYIKSTANEKKIYKRILHVTKVHLFVFVFDLFLVNERLSRHQKQRETCCNMQKEGKSVKKRKPTESYVHDLFVSYGCKAKLIPRKAARQCYRSSSCQHSQGTLWKTGNQATHSNNNLCKICGNIHQSMLNG